MTTVAEMTRSMSRVGNFIDNAPIDSLFIHFKCEKYNLKNCCTFEEVEKDIDAYIKFYNEERYQEKLNSLELLFFLCLLDRAQFRITFSEILFLPKLSLIG